jgi:hypothetical protein
LFHILLYISFVYFLLLHSYFISFFYSFIFWSSIPAYDSMDTMIHAALRAAQTSALVTVGDLTVVVGGGPSAPLGQANFLHLITIPE